MHTQKNSDGDRTLPPEIIDRLESLHQHTTLPQQTMTFSVDLPCGNGKRLRWNRKLKQLTLPHIIDSNDRGEVMSLHLLHEESCKVLSLCYENGEWRRSSLKTLNVAEKDVPNRHKHGSKRWFRKPATTAQLQMMRKILKDTSNSLPPLTAYNANMIINTHRLMPHMRRIRGMIDLWLAELGHSPRAPLLPFTELESA
ncbi:hypothetical protein [Cerasicoccus fimbriatus]|uniref:hypothetical protein n=1 Tax=Cerasicoccus fimbriatus TaxID=3014554 RepID=UPI0022B52ECC|nr:hypothetical protein [Cerasicoccus sp. TK19100]